MSQKPHNILIVDQLWLWIIQTPNERDTIITSFPNREGAPPAPVDNLQMQILEDPIHRTEELVGKILVACCQTLSPNQGIDSVKFVQIFESTIAHLVSAVTLSVSHICCSRCVPLQEEDVSILFQEFRFLSIYLQRQGEHSAHIQKQRRFLLGELLNISKESRPLMEAKDILDEIKIIQTTLGDQLTVLDSSEMSALGMDAGIWKARDILFRARRSFDILKARAEAVEKSVSLGWLRHIQPTKFDQIEHLLDLKQKQANLWEARTSREGADETAKQGDVCPTLALVKRL